MLSEDVDKVDKEAIERLHCDRVAEGRRLDYKLELPGGKDEDRKDFLADVSAFANVAGGFLVYGVDEERGPGSEKTGLIGSIPGLAKCGDEEIRRLEQLVTDGLEPRLTIYTKIVPGFPQGPVLVIRIPQSWAAPHMVTFKNSARFYTRTSGGKHPMDVTELRGAFAASDAVAERVTRFRDGRVAKIIAGETPVSLPAGPKLILHLVPLASTDPAFRIDIKALKQRAQDVWLMSGSGWNSRFNIDGFVSFAREETNSRTYTQVFRNGRIEAVVSGLGAEVEGKKLFATYFDTTLFERMPRQLQLLGTLGIGAPVVVLVSIVGVQDYCLAVERDRLIFADHKFRFDRPDLLLPDVTFEQLDSSIPEVMRPIVDSVWQAAGEHGCPYYDADGRYDPRRR